ncbi:MAG: FAD-dependent oxidoreductase [Campylobacterales bacterium]|nr:FAD-dependent oxidoreductase [Campylobacterales bacterium]
MRNEHTDILVLGGGPAALVTVGTALENFPDKKITVIKEDDISLVPCGIPYIFGKTLGDSSKDAMSCGGPMAEMINIIVDTALSVDIENKTVFAKTHTITFDKLIFATGSLPFVHKSFEDALHLENVFTIEKHKDKVDLLKNYLADKQKVIIVGTGFIGVEMAMELRSVGKEVTIIGGRHILADAFDVDMALQAEEIMKEAGITLSLGQHVSQILQSDGKASCVELCDGSCIHGDVIILATGYQPNSVLAKEAGLKLARYGGIWVDEYMRTKNKDIFAVGDCCGRRDFITRDPSKVMLASTSASEARVAGNSLYGLKYLKGFNGTIAIFSTMIGNRVFASAGVTESRAKHEKIEYTVGFFEGLNRHPSTIPDASKQSVKLIALKSSGQIIGGQVIGDKEAGEVINIIGLAIESELTAHKLVSLQVATQPLLTAAPTTYPIIKAAQQIIRN